MDIDASIKRSMDTWIQRDLLQVGAVDCSVLLLYIHTEQLYTKGIHLKYKSKSKV